MELRQLPLMLLLFSNIHSGHAKEIPKPVLSVKSKASQISRGDTVELECKIQGNKWKYTFECGSERHTSNDDDYKIIVQFTQTCRCNGSSSSVSSEWSNEVTLTVLDNQKLSIKPQSSVFTGDTVTLSCDVGRSTGQMIFWYKDNSRTNTGDETKTLTDVKISDGGLYRCCVKGGTQGPAVELTVTERPKAAVLVQPDGRIIRGQTVTFTCDIQASDVTHWSYNWTKDGLVIQFSASQEYRISSVDESHTGNYSCTGSETGGSRCSHTSDELTLTVSDGTDSKVALIIAVTAGLGVLFLLIFSLLLLWRRRHKKGEGFLSPSTGQQQHNISQTSEDQKREQTQRSDSINGPPDVTYAQIEMKTKTERKKNKDSKGHTGETSDTVYSKLKIETG